MNFCQLLLVNLDEIEFADALNKLFITFGLIEKLGKNARKEEI